MPNLGWPELTFVGVAIALFVCLAVWAGHEKTRELEAMLGCPPVPGQPVYKPQGNGLRLLAFIIDFSNKHHAGFNFVDLGIGYPFNGLVTQGAFQQTFGIADTA